MKNEEPSIIKGKEQVGRNAVLLSLLSYSEHPLSERIKIADYFIDTLFTFESGQKWDGKSIAVFLVAAANLFKHSETDQELKDLLWNRITPQILDRLLDESSIEHWDGKEVSACLEAYCTFQNLERMLGPEETRETVRDISYASTKARIFDEHFEPLARGGNGKDGFILALNYRGSELMQVIASEAYRKALADLAELSDDGETTLPLRELYATYYRGIPGVMNFGSLTNENTDPKGNRMTITDVVAQLKRRTTDRVDGPLQLAIPVMVNKDGEESIIFPMPQVGGAIIPAAARVHGLTLDEAERQGIGYSVDYLGVNGFKNVPWFARPSAALIFGGDGTEPLGSSGQSMMKRTASVFVMLNNGMQIGARLKDVYAGELEDIGVSEGVPGIRAGKTEVDRAYLAVYFATRRAIMGGGSTNLNLETSLLVPHSISHGEYQVGVYFKKFERIISEQGVDGEFVDKLFRIGQSQSIEKVQEGVIELLREPYNIPQDLREALMIFVAEVVDPNDIIDEFIEQGYLTDEERSQWQTLAHEEFAAAVKEIDILPLASKEHTMLQPIRFPLRNKKKLIAPLPEGAPKILRAGMAEAMAHVIDKALSDPAHRLMVQGVDTNKGYKVERNRLTGQGEAIITGGYWEQTALSREPLRLESFESGQINEELLIQWAIGMSLNSMRRPEEGHQTVVDLQYVDYASKALGYLAYLLQQPNVTAAQMTLRFGLIATTGLSAGVSPGHGAEYTGFFNNLPDVMDFYYPSTAQDMYDLMMSALYGGLDHPFLLLWPRNNPFAKEDISLQLTLDSLPGKARMRVNQEPTDNLFQIISWGPMMIKVREELAKREKTDGVAMWKGLNHFDPRTLRPFDYEGLHQYLKLGAPTGAPIIIMEEGYPGKDFGTSLYAKIMMDPFFADVLNNGRRQIRVLGALPLDANPASVIMQQEVLPNVSHLFDLLKARDRTGLNALYNRHFQYAR